MRTIKEEEVDLSEYEDYTDMVVPFVKTVLGQK